MSDAPIGIFDSGVGGLTVARAILDQLPNESTLYIGDTARGPYGPRSLAEVRTYSLETLDYLVEQGDPYYGRECVNFENSKYGCFLVDLPNQFTNINDMREEKINSLLEQN